MNMMKMFGLVGLFYCVAFLMGIIHVQAMATDFDINDEDVINCTSVAHFDSTVFDSADGKSTLVRFFAPWCEHSRQLQSQFQRAATMLVDKNLPAHVMDVDCVSEETKEICARYNITGYPTLAVFHTDEESASGEHATPVLYHGERHAHPIYYFMKRQLQPTFKLLDTNIQLYTFKSNTPLGLIAYTELDSEMFTTITSLSKTLRRHPQLQIDVGIVVDKNLFGTTMEPHIEFVRQSIDPMVVPYTGFVSVKNLGLFLEMESFPVFGELNTVKEFRAFVHRGYPMLQIFMNDFKDESLAALERLAMDYKGQFSFLKINLGEWAVIANEIGLSNDDAPAVVITNPVTRKHFVMEGELTASNVQKFCNDYNHKNLQPILRSQPIPVEENQQRPVIQLVGKTFEDVVFDDEKDVFVKFYSPYCPHSNSSAAAFTDVGNVFDDTDTIVIAEIDITANDLPINYVNGTPTFMMFAGESKKGREFEGERSVEAMTRYILDTAKATANTKIIQLLQRFESEDDSKHEEL